MPGARASCPPKRARARFAVEPHLSTLRRGASRPSRSRAHGGQGCPRSRRKSSSSVTVCCRVLLLRRRGRGVVVGVAVRARLPYEATGDLPRCKFGRVVHVLVADDDVEALDQHAQATDGLGDVGVSAYALVYAIG